MEEDSAPFVACDYKSSKVIHIHTVYSPSQRRERETLG